MPSGRPSGPARHKFAVNVRPEIAEEVRELAQHERRTINNQVEILIERGLRSYPRLGELVPLASGDALVASA